MRFPHDTVENPCKMTNKWTTTAHVAVGFFMASASHGVTHTRTFHISGKNIYISNWWVIKLTQTIHSCSFSEFKNVFWIGLLECAFCTIHCMHLCLYLCYFCFEFVCFLKQLYISILCMYFDIFIRTNSNSFVCRFPVESKVLRNERMRDKTKYVLME